MVLSLTCALTQAFVANGLEDSAAAFADIDTDGLGFIEADELRGAAWLLLQAGGGSVALRVPLWPLMGSLAAGMGPRGRFRAGCGRLGAPGVRARPPCAFHRGASRPSASSRAARTSAIDDRKMAQKRRERSKAALPAKTQLENAMDLCEESSNDSADTSYGPSGCHLGCLRGPRVWPLLLLCVEY